MALVNWAEGLEGLMVPIDSVQQHPDNTNNGDLDAITESIRVNGYNAPIVVERNTGYIVAGNHRWQALHGLGATQVPVIWTDMSPDAAKRYMIGDNKTGQLAQQDEAALAAMLKELQKTDMGLFGTGFTDETLNQLLEDLAAEMLPESEGMGQASMGIYQVVVDFDGQPDDRDDFYAEMLERFGGEAARKVDM